MNHSTSKEQLQQQENDLIAQSSNNITFDPPQIPGYFQALFQNQSSDKQTYYTHGSWSQQEDELLKSAIAQVGTKKWSNVAKFIPTRTSKQCRERWSNRLDPALKHSPYEPWEDQIIIEKQKEFGNRWTIIAELLPGRSPGSVKNRWYSGLKVSRSSYRISQNPQDGIVIDSLTMLPHDQGNSVQNNPEL
ncbi:Myb-like DNA-binding domain containing protein [Histomonas meleagridis]|uniref:Myb-like DNA-binding domain containing protein n=1 Tax=Histomonas meleagridis TaxID=135588 RepID=UPI003559753F|nr:Myb-like DNA-binding domain containing protein [Histomonas meleagridis]KAH0806358.1 Myb-like DNA-binding domain containing protein [Histomonas meleagridis]